MVPGCRMSVSVVVVGSWLSDVGSCSCFLVVGCCVWFLGVGCCLSVGLLTVSAVAHFRFGGGAQL
jgi:hypothetical protein